MLSRVADALYWMGRYLERAENATRLLLVTEELASEVVGPRRGAGARGVDELRTIFPGADGGEPAQSLRPPRRPRSSSCPCRRPPALDPLLAEEGAGQRANVREALTIEVFVNLNETYRELEAHKPPDRRPDDVPGRALRSAARDPGHGRRHRVHARARSGLALSEARRVDRARLPHRRRAPREAAHAHGAGAQDRPAAVLHALARPAAGLSSLENYLKRHGAHIEPDDALQFLLFDAHTPRSVRYGTTAVKDILERISGPNHLSLPARIMGKLSAELVYQGQDVLRNQPHPVSPHAIN